MRFFHPWAVNLGRPGNVRFAFVWPESHTANPSEKLGTPTSGMCQHCQVAHHWPEDTQLLHWTLDIRWKCFLTWACVVLFYSTDTGESLPSRWRPGSRCFVTASELLGHYVLPFFLLWTRILENQPQVNHWNERLVSTLVSGSKLSRTRNFIAWDHYLSSLMVPVFFYFLARPAMLRYRLGRVLVVLIPLAMLAQVLPNVSTHR